MTTRRTLIKLSAAGHSVQIGVSGIALVEVQDETNADRIVGRFDKTTAEKLFFLDKLTCPGDSSGNITVKLYGYAPALTTGTVWGGIGWRAINNGENIDPSFTQVLAAAAVTVPGTAKQRFEITATITAPAWQEGDDVEFYVIRDASSDSLNEDWYFTSMTIDFQAEIT